MAESTGGIENLPASVQVAVNAALFIVTAVFAIFGYTKKQLGKKLDEQKSQDTVVISAAFADSKVIERLDESLQESIAIQQSQLNATNYLTEAVRQLTMELVRGNR